MAVISTVQVGYKRLCEIFFIILVSNSSNIIKNKLRLCLVPDSDDILYKDSILIVTNLNYSFVSDFISPFQTIKNLDCAIEMTS